MVINYLMSNVIGRVFWRLGSYEVIHRVRISLVVMPLAVSANERLGRHEAAPDLGQLR